MTTIATGNRRLLKLAEFLDALPRERFDYDRWVGSNWKGAPDLSCGTTACAGGWATTMPEFRRLGLRLKARPLSDGIYDGFPVFGDEESTMALATLFILSLEESESLFYPLDEERHATPKQVARKIRRFVKARA